MGTWKLDLMSHLVSWLPEGRPSQPTMASLQDHAQEAGRVRIKAQPGGGRGL